MKDDGIFEGQNSLPSKVESLDLPSTCSDNLLVLKRVGEIKEAPEYRAKKKHEAKLQMKRLREFKKMQIRKLRESKLHQVNALRTDSAKLKVKTFQDITKSDWNNITIMPKLENGDIMHFSQQIGGIRDSTHTTHHPMVKLNPQIQAKKLQALSPLDQKLSQKGAQGLIEVNQQQQKNYVISKSEMEKFKKRQKTITGTSPKAQMKRVRVLSQAEAEKIQNNPNAQIQKIRVYSKNQLNKTQDDLPLHLINGKFGIQHDKKSEISRIQHEIKHNEKNKYLGHKTYENGIFSLSNHDTNSKKIDVSENFFRMGKLMNDTIESVDQVLKKLEKSSPHQFEVSFLKF